jgi:hypothetical protein
VGDQLLSQLHVLLDNSGSGQDQVSTGLEPFGLHQKSVLLSPDLEFFWIDWHFYQIVFF